MEVRRGPGNSVLDGDPAPPSRKSGRSPQFSAYVYCGQMAGWIKMPLTREIGLSQSDIMLDGDPAPPPPKEHSPQIFGPYLLWTNGCMDQDATWYVSRPQPKHIVLDVLQLPLPIRGQSPQFSADVYCRQTAGWMKMPLGTEVYLSPGHIVLEGIQLPPRKGHSSPPFFSAHVSCGHGRPSQLLLSSFYVSYHETDI